MEIFAKNAVQSQTFRLALNRTRPQKLKELQKLLLDVGVVRRCKLNMSFFHAFNIQAMYDGEKITIPTNGLGVASLELTFSEESTSIPFFTISTFQDLANFISNVDYYSGNPEFLKSFHVEEDNNLQSHIVVDVTLAT